MCLKLDLSDQLKYISSHSKILFSNLRQVYRFLMFQNRQIVKLVEQQYDDKNDDSIPVWRRSSKIGSFSDGPESGVKHEKSQGDPYREFLKKTSAYSWLLAVLRRELTLVNQEDNVLKTIRQTIHQRSSIVSKLTPRLQTNAVTFVFKVRWDRTDFEEGQERYVVPIEEAITLTGSLTNVQALPCIQYLRQTWPLNGEYIFRLLQKLMSSNDEQLQGTIVFT